MCKIKALASIVAEKQGASIVNRDRMWHYVEGLHNWDPIWPTHAIRIIPGPSSLWFDAKVVSNRNWTHRNVVLIGDALRTVHFSLGSGTRMAMQDAIVLHRGLVKHPDDVAAAFREFESLRRPASSAFQGAAAKSLDWYEKVASKMHLDPISFAYDYMRRTDQVSHDDLAERDPHFTKAFEALQQHA